MSGYQKLQIGLLHDSVYANRYIRDLIVWARQQDDLEISHLIVHAVPNKTRARNWRRKFAQHGLGWFRGGIFKSIRLVEQQVLRVYSGGSYREHTRESRIDDLIPNILSIQPGISKSGLIHRFAAEEVAKVRATGCDVLLRAGTGILQGEILEAAPFGVLSLHHSDNRVNRGGPAGFWESYLEWPATGFVIQRLTPELTGGDVLMRGSYPTKWFFLLNQASLFTKSNVHLKDLLKKVARERSLPPSEDPVPYSARLFDAPSVSHCLAYIGRVAARSIRRAASSLFRYRYRWSVSFAFTEWRRAVLWRAKTPAPPPGRFLADPFVWRHEGKTFCLMEDYAFGKRVGWISAMEIDGQNTTRPEPVLIESFHLSFPYIFEFNGSIYMCPECSASGQVRLYRSTEFPRKWVFVKTLMNDVSAADTMLFEKGGRWWMLTNLDRTRKGDFGAELYLFSAESPLSDLWVSHPANPLKIDPVGGRNAGLLRDGERLFRAGQVQGFDQYGAGIRLFEITCLSPGEYQERLVSEIHPAFRKGLLGTHHISSVNGVTVVDSVRREFVW
jgi:hypothetical protein